jgi:hypothetical protein
MIIQAVALRTERDDRGENKHPSPLEPFCRNTHRNFYPGILRTDYATMSNQLVLYRSPDGEVKVEVLYRDENFWMPQKAIAELFGVRVPAISKHLSNIYESGELKREATVSSLEIVRTEGTRQVTRTVEHYNLDAIIAIGYRVSSYQATQFRIWATETLKGYLIKGFAINDDRFKEARDFGPDYFDELLERISMTMSDWVGFLDPFLQLSDYPVLRNKGTISALEAKLKAEAEYAEFRVHQDRAYVSDFDREVRRIQELNGEGD